MSNNQIANEWQEFENLTSPMARGYDRFYVPITASDYMDMLAELLFQSINQISVKELPFSQVDITNTFRWLVDARCLYVSGGRVAIHPKDIEYPAFLGPVLESIGSYQDPRRGYELLPMPSDPKWHEVKDGIITGVNRKIALEIPDYLGTIMFWLKHFGVTIARGLPFDKQTKTDELFRLEVAGKYLYGTEPVAPNGATIGARILLNFKFLSEVYGTARVTYAAIETFRSALASIVERSVRGPRIARST